MKGIVRIITLVALIAVLGVALVACLPSKGMDAAKAAWKSVVSHDLLKNASEIKLESVDFKRYDQLADKNPNCYQFRFTLSYVDADGKKNENVVLYGGSNPTNGGGYVSWASSSGDSYARLDKSKDQIKVTKTDSLSKGQVKKLMAYYEEIKDDLWKEVPAPQEAD